MSGRSEGSVIRNSPLLQAFLAFAIVLVGSQLFAPQFGDKYAPLHSIFLQILLVFGIPFVTSQWLKLNKRTVFSLNPTSLGNLACSVLIALSLTILLEEMGYLQLQLIGVTSSKEISIYELLQAHNLGELWWMFFSLALIPAVCEEFLFRGFIFNRLKHPNQIAEAVMLSSVLFGVFHREIPELLNNTVAAIVLSVIVFRSGSLYNSLLAHAVMNTVAISIVNSQTVQSIFRIGQKAHLPSVFLVTSAAGLIFGIRGLRSQKNME